MRTDARLHGRFYQDLARRLAAELAEGGYPVESRLPAEREMAQQYNVSRPTVREAIIALAATCRPVLPT